jgi:polysaccharide export outer membrane protein
MRSLDRLRGCLLAGLVAWSCACNKGSKYGTGNPFTPVDPPQNECVPTGLTTPVPPSDPYAPLATYLLRVGDQIQFTLSVDPQPQAGDYRISVHDTLNIEYLHEPAPDRRLRTQKVLPNGTIDLPLIGSVSVVGKTVQEAKREINRLAREFYRFPQIEIEVIQAGALAEELRKSFSSGFTNQSLTVVVNPDGTINLPEIGTMHVWGRTLPEIREEANQLYAKATPGVQVWPHLTQRAPDQVYVHGQVLNPGQILLNRPTHVSQAIAQAGGWLFGAELREVILIRYREGDPQAVRLDIHSAIRQDLRPRCVDLTDDVLLADGDVIIVPRDCRQNMNDYIRQVFSLGLYGVLPMPTVKY